jgi:hypothetical protein
MDKMDILSLSIEPNQHAPKKNKKVHRPLSHTYSPRLIFLSSTRESTYHVTPGRVEIVASSSKRVIDHRFPDLPRLYALQIRLPATVTRWGLHVEFAAWKGRGSFGSALGNFHPAEGNPLETPFPLLPPNLQPVHTHNGLQNWLAPKGVRIFRSSISPVPVAPPKTPAGVFVPFRGPPASFDSSFAGFVRPVSFLVFLHYIQEGSSVFKTFILT